MRGRSAAALVSLLTCASACDDGASKRAEPASSPLGAAGVCVYVQIRDFVEYSKLEAAPGRPVGDRVTMEVVEAAGLEHPVVFDVSHPGPAPADAIWRDVGATYAITLHKGFLKNAQEPPRPDQILGPIELVSKPDARAVPRYPALVHPPPCAGGPDLIEGAPLEPVTGPGFVGVVIPAAAAAAALTKCQAMLDPPFTADGFWTPTQDDVRKLENTFPKRLQAHAGPPRPHSFKDTTALGRQYVGYESGGKRLLRVTLIPWWDAYGLRCRVVDLCYLGHRFFAVDVDAATGEIVRFVADPA